MGVFRGFAAFFQGLAFIVGTPKVWPRAVVPVIVGLLLLVGLGALGVVTALLLAWGLVDYPLALEGMGIRDRLRWSRRNFGAMLGFGLAATVAFAVPGLGLLLLPCGVAGSGSAHPLGVLSPISIRSMA